MLNGQKKVIKWGFFKIVECKRINIMKILYDKWNKRRANINYFTDEDGGIWIDVDPMGVDMSGMIRIRKLLDNDQYEIRQTNN